MSSRDVINRTEKLSKGYWLHTKPHDRFLDMFGLLCKPNANAEYLVLQGFNLEIRRDAKVAFICRNGAGKSTLLTLFQVLSSPVPEFLQPVRPVLLEGVKPRCR